MVICAWSCDLVVFCFVINLWCQMIVKHLCWNIAIHECITSLHPLVISLKIITILGYILCSICYVIVYNCVLIYMYVIMCYIIHCINLYMCVCVYNIVMYVALIFGEDESDYFVYIILNGFIVVSLFIEYLDILW